MSDKYFICDCGDGLLYHEMDALEHSQLPAWSPGNGSDPDRKGSDPNEWTYRHDMSEENPMTTTAVHMSTCDPASWEEMGGAEGCNGPCCDCDPCAVHSGH